MSKKMNVIYAAIGAAVLFGTPALAASYVVRHDIPVNDHTAPGIKTTVARSQGIQVYAYAPATMGTQDPTMFAVQHDIPVKDHTSPK